MVYSKKNRTGDPGTKWWPLTYRLLMLGSQAAILVIIIVVLTRQNNSNHQHHHGDDDDDYKYSSGYRTYQAFYAGTPFARYNTSSHCSVNAGPNARQISSKIMAYDTTESNSTTCEIMRNRFNLSMLAVAMLQLADHDFTHVLTGQQYGVMNVDMSCDPIADPHCIGRSISMKRSKYVLDAYGKRQQINELTPYMDLHNMYGSDPKRAHLLREHKEGRMKTSKNGRRLPRNTYGLSNAGGDFDSNLYLAGDLRANENPGLLALQTLLVLNHNYWADRLHKKYDGWSDEQLYWTARRIVTAEVQYIFFNELLPAIIGELPEAAKDVRADPRLHNSFATAGYRMGHTLVGESVHLYGSRQNCIPLSQSFFNVSILDAYGLEAIIGGLVHQPAEEFDAKIVPSLRTGLHFDRVLDLAVLNLMRGRDHELPYYHELRAALTGYWIGCWSEICSNKDVLKSMEELYGKDGWKKLDPWLGILSEDPVGNSMLGITGTALLRSQFDIMRSSDEYYYKWDRWFTSKLKKNIERTSMYGLIVRNTGLKAKDLPRNKDVFHVW